MVLILVVMDDHLRVQLTTLHSQDLYVLILVVMDDPLRVQMMTGTKTIHLVKVLILVVMDDPLRVNRT